MAERRVVYVLAAGVDAPMGIPTVTDLLPAIAQFAGDEGKLVQRALRDKIGPRFHFDRCVGDQREAFGERLLADDGGGDPACALAVQVRPTQLAHPRKQGSVA